MIVQYVSLVGDGERELDRLEVDGAAQVKSTVTGRGRATVEMLARRYPVPAEALKIMAAWSNGYVLLRQVDTDGAQ